MKQENVTFFDEVAQEERQVGPHCHRPLLRKEVMCPKRQFEHVMKLGGTLGVMVRGDVCFAVTQPRTEPIDELNAIRMRPYIFDAHTTFKNCIGCR